MSELIKPVHYQSERSWESYQWSKRLAPELKMAAQLLSLIPEDPSRVERLLHMEPGTLLKLWEENEYFLPAATEWDSDDEIRTGKRSTSSKG